MAEFAAPWSLRARVVVHVGAAACGVWLCLTGVVYLASRSNSRDAFDRELERHATLVLAYAEHEYRESTGAVALDSAAEARAFREEFAYQILTRDGAILARSSTAPASSLGPLLQPGFADIDTRMGSWRVLTFVSERTPVVVKVAQSKSLRDALTLGIARSLLWPLLLALPVLLLFAAIAVKRVLRPFEDWRLALDVDSSGEHARVMAAHLPVELQPAARSLNALLDRQSRWIDHERAFTANAAHELRTPLAALRAQTQIALRLAESHESRAALQKQIAAIDRMSRLVTQLLALARIDVGAGSATGERANLEHATRLVIQELSAAGDCEPEAIQLITSANEPIVALSTDVAVLVVRNLLNNAIQYGGKEPIEVRIGATATHVVLEILDHGPGLQPGERSRVTQRFYRVLGSRGTGSGLGLSIVNRAIETVGGSLRFSDTEDSHGLHVIVTLPRAPLVNSSAHSHTQKPQTHSTGRTLTSP